MKNSFISVIRVPDDIKIQTENSPLRYEEKGVENPTDARIQFEIKGDCLRVMLMPSKDAVKRIRMRFRGDLSGVRARLGDAWERSSTETMQWKAFVPHEMLPWYFYASDGARLHAYGVKTGGNSYALWQCDPCGITLTLDVRCGTDGVRVTEPLMCAEVICRRGEEGEEPFAAAREFCRMMCAHPNLPAEPVYGLNNWYWAYGNTDQQTLVGEARYLAQLSAGCAASPYMVMDDGWQICHTKGYNGGPWTACNERFSSMAETAAQIKAEGCRPGIWFRPLRTLGHVPQEAVYDTPYAGMGLVMDPTHPFTLQRVEEDAARLASWGFELIKHDFTTLDLYGRWIPDDRPLHFYDRSLTNAQIEKRIYETVQRGAGGAVVIGCNTCGHLAAGIHQVQRIGEDTSGRSFEWTRRGGIHSMMRLPQAGVFSQIDPDCAAFTARVSSDLNLDFMEAMAISGSTVFASITPGILNSAEEQRASDIMRIAASIKPEEYAVALDWHRTSEPREYLFRGREYVYDWYRDYDGCRDSLTWLD